MNASLTPISLPLFPLHTVLFPHGYLPLRVFEPRYRSMVQSCREQGTPFGVVTLLTGHELLNTAISPETFHLIGTTAAIDQCSSLSTGMELVQCSGCERFRVLRTRRPDGQLWMADVQILPPDAPIVIPQDLEPSAKALRQVLSKVPRRSTQAIEDAKFTDCGWVANRWCELLPMSQQTQLQLLALDSPLLRLELVTDALEHAGILS